MGYCEQRLAPSWSRWIECAWSMETETPLRGYAVRPDGCVDILFSPEEGLRTVGAMTVEQRYDIPAGVRSVAVRFQPGMAGVFLGVSPAELTDRIVALGDVWGARARGLEDRLRQARSPGETMQVLLEGIPHPAGSPNPVQRAIEAITSQNGVCDLEQVAAQANLSLRQFHRRCLEEAGLAPKHLSRVLRFRYACRLAGTFERPAWSGIAAEAGYFDQAHLIRDFHEFAGGPPTSVFSNTTPGLSG